MNMVDEATPAAPSPEAIAAAEKMGREFLQTIAAVPDSDRTPLTSKKFAGPIA